jgi:hypothetical protein
MIDDLMTRAQVAEYLGVSVSKLVTGWGPRPLPDYRRPLRYSREVVDLWLQHQRERAWQSTSAAIRPTGGSSSASPAVSTAAARASGIAERLRARNGLGETPSGPPLLVVIPEDL